MFRISISGALKWHSLDLSALHPLGFEATRVSPTRAPPRESGADLRGSVDAIVVCHFPILLLPPPPTTLQSLVPTHSHSWLVVDAIKLS